MDFKEKAGELALAWGVPAAIGLAVLGGCELDAYMHKDDPKEVVEQRAKDRAEYHKRHKDDGIAVLPAALGM